MRAIIWNDTINKIKTRIKPLQNRKREAFFRIMKQDEIVPNVRLPLLESTALAQSRMSLKRHSYVVLDMAKQSCHLYNLLFSYVSTFLSPE